MARIALLEDDLDQSAIIETWIVEAGHTCTIFNKGKLLIRAISHETFDVLILDWMLPDIEGIDVLKWVRKQNNRQIPVLFATAKDSESNIISALNEGADDYMAKPVKKGELLARLNALLRRTQTVHQDSEEIQYGVYTVLTASCNISVDGNLVELTQKEFELMLFLFQNVGRIVSRSYILESVWGSSNELKTRTVDTHASRIRSKLALKGEHGWFLRSIYQHGYRLEFSESVDKSIEHIDVE